MELLIDKDTLRLVAFHHTGTAGIYCTAAPDKPRRALLDELADAVADHFGYANVKA